MTFATMRQRLIDRGLIDAEFRLTPAGNDHVAGLIGQLRRVDAANDREGRRVRWRR